MTNAKKKKSLLYVALSLALSVVLLVGVLVIHTAAENAEGSGDPYVEILSKNVEYSDKLHIMFALETNYPENAGVQFWASESAVGSAELGYTADVYDYLTREEYKDTALYGKPYVRTEGIAAKDIVKDIYARAYVTVDGETYYSEVIRYSVLEYMHERLFDLSAIDDAEKTPKQKNQVILYNRTLEYGAAAQTVLGIDEGDRFASDEFVFVEVVGGTLSDGYTSGLYTPGASVTVNATDIEGREFAGWSDGTNTVSTEASYTFDINKSVRLTATYAAPAATVIVNDGEGVEYDIGDTVTVTAEDKSASKYVFKRWTLDGASVSTNAAYSFTVTEAMSGKTLKLVSEYYSPVTVTVTNGSGAGKYAVGESYTVTADDRTASKYVFRAWSGASTSTSESVTVKVTTAMAGNSYAYTANYYAPTVVTVNYGTGAGTYAYGEAYTVTAGRDGYLFLGWSDGVKTLSRTATAGAAGGTVAYTASFQQINTATFDDAAVSEAGSQSISGEYNGVTISGSTTNEHGGYEIVYDPEDPTNKVVRIYENTTETYTGSASNGSFTIDIAGSGSITVVEFDMYIASSGGSSAMLEMYFGTGGWSGVYQGRVDYTYQALKLVTVAGTEKTVEDPEAPFAYGEWNHVRYEYYYHDSTSFTMVLYLNGKPVAISTSGYNSNPRNGLTKLHIWQMGALYGEFYYDNISAYNTTSPILTIPTELDKSGIDYDDIEAKMHEYRENANDAANKYAWEHRYDKITAMYPDDAAKAEAVIAALEEIDGLFTADTYKWLAGLYDPKTGGIYYSNSARDNFGYLPDIESTAQANGVLSSLNLPDLKSLLNASQRAKASAWVQMMQSNRDGAYYHPQWRTDIGDSRRARDLGNAGSIINWGSGLTYVSGETNILFDSALYRLGDPDQFQGMESTTKLTYSVSASAASLVSKVVMAASTSNPVHLQSIENYNNYLNTKWTGDLYSNNNYAFGNTITAQGSQILAAGPEFVAATIEFLNAKQQAVQDERARLGLGPNGLWQVDAEVDANGILVKDNYASYGAINGLLKISGVYNKMAAVIPYRLYAMQGAVQMMCATAEGYNESIVAVYNPPFSILNIQSNIANCGDGDENDNGVNDADEAAELLKKDAAAIIKTTADKISIYLKDDGSFSYSPTSSASTSQGEPAAVSGSNEGDVNGVALAQGARKMVLEVLGITGIPVLPAYKGAVQYDFGDGKGLVDTTHAAIFRHLITTAKVAEKFVATTTSIYTFEDGKAPAEYDNGTHSNKVILDPDNASNHILYVDDGSSDSGYSISLDAGMDLSSAVPYNYFKTDIRFENLNTSTPLQISLGSTFMLQLSRSGSTLTLQGRDVAQVLTTETATVTFNSEQWATLEVKVYPNGITVDGNTKYAEVKVTQNGTTNTAYFSSFYDATVIGGGMQKVSILMLKAETGEYYLDNVECCQYGQTTAYGVYNFDEMDQKPLGVTGGTMVVDPENRDNMLNVQNETVTMYTTPGYAGKFNFAELQFTMNLRSYKVGDTGFINMLDRDGDVIISYKYVIGNGSITFYNAASAQKMIEITDIDLTKDITVRTEYHYDVGQLDLIVKHTRLSNGYMKNAAATMSGVQTAEADATAADFQIFSFGTNSSSVYINDVFARRITTVALPQNDSYIYTPVVSQ